MIPSLTLEMSYWKINISLLLRTFALEVLVCTRGLFNYDIVFTSKNVKDPSHFPASAFSRDTSVKLIAMPVPKFKEISQIVYRTRAITYKPRLVYFLLHFHCGLYCRAVSVADNLYTKQGNSSIFGPTILQIGF